MFAECNFSGMFAQLMSLDFKFLNSLQTNTEYFNTNYKIPLYFSNRFTINHHDIIGRELYK